ncbi:MAG: Ig-like domain-containing protein, partial [Bacillota bacterium]|nr:Ig-like domain-containing protein [Bacillota bacterium]
MKRVGALICVMIMAVAVLAPAAFAANDAEATMAQKAGFALIESSPEDGATGVAVDNLSVKIKFSKDMRPKDADMRKSNAKKFVLTDSENNKVPVKVYYSDETEGLLLVAADVYSGNKTRAIKSDEEYTLTISKDLQATDGTTLGEQTTITMKTLNQSRSTMIYMVLMVLMMGGMIFFVIRGT